MIINYSIVYISITIMWDTSIKNVEKGLPVKFVEDSLEFINKKYGVNISDLRHTYGGVHDPNDTNSLYTYREILEKEKIRINPKPNVKITVEAIFSM